VPVRVSHQPALPPEAPCAGGAVAGRRAGGLDAKPLEHLPASTVGGTSSRSSLGQPPSPPTWLKEDRRRRSCRSSHRAIPGSASAEGQLRDDRRMVAALPGVRIDLGPAGGELEGTVSEHAVELPWARAAVVRVRAHMPAVRGSHAVAAVLHGALGPVGRAAWRC
jgi:hypothetical protein